MIYQRLHIYRSLWEEVIVKPAAALGDKRKKMQNITEWVFILYRTVMDKCKNKHVYEFLV